jgi:Asp-tRNA(Asn)/Glu-tRNA(Gln) amidotransferase A subunit family amidase
LTGLPSLSLPLLAGEGGLPLGVPLVGAAGHDARLLRTAGALIGTLTATEKAKKKASRSSRAPRSA